MEGHRGLGGGGEWGAGKPAWRGCCSLASGEDGGSLLLERSLPWVTRDPWWPGSISEPTVPGAGGAGRLLCLLIHMDFTPAPPPQTGDTKTAEDQRL